MVTLESIDKKIETLIGGLDKKINVLDVKFNGLDAKVAGLDKKIGRLDEKFIGLDTKFNVLDTKFEGKIDALSRKVDDKVDELAAMTARGFLELRGEIKSDMHEVIDRLEVIEENYVTKDDFVKFGRNMDLMLDKHIGTFRKDTEGLAKRTKDLEKVAFATS